MMPGRFRVGRYDPLITYLRVQEADLVFLTFAELETILGTALAKTARECHGYWMAAAYRHVADLERAGWAAHLHEPAGGVAFRRSE
jgi:hypothetical protein